jgi:hypothetical protein
MTRAALKSKGRNNGRRLTGSATGLMANFSAVALLAYRNARD